MRRRAVREELFAAAKHDRQREDTHRVDQIIGEQRMDEFGAALSNEVRPVFLPQAFHVGESRRSTEPPTRIDLARARIAYFLMRLNSLAMSP